MKETKKDTVRKMLEAEEAHRRRMEATKKELCPFHPANNGTCDLSEKAPHYCRSWCWVRKKIKKKGEKSI